jgi:cell division protein FtsQ
VRDQRIRKRRRTNRRRTAPLWRRLSLRGLLSATGRGLRRSGPVWIAAALCVATVFGVKSTYTWLKSSPRFAVQQVDLVGELSHDQEAVRERLDQARGENIFELSPGIMAEELESNPWIAEADVRRELPNRLVVTATEREAAAVVELDGLYLTDADGIAFKRLAVSEGEGADLPVITGITREVYLADELAAQAKIRQAIALVELYQQNPDRPALGEVALGKRTTLYTYDRGTAIVVGDAAPTAVSKRLKLFDVAWAALDGSERKSARTIYVDNGALPNRATVAFAANR